MKEIVYARIEIDTDTLVDMPPRAFHADLGEILKRALEPLVDVEVTTFAPREDTILARSLAAVFEE